VEEDIHAGPFGNDIEAALDCLWIVKGRDPTETYVFHDTSDGPQFDQQLLCDTEHHLLRLFSLGIQAAVGGHTLHGGRSAQTTERLEQRSAGTRLGSTDRSGRSGGPAPDYDHVILMSA
jgi:hypothetical protein